MLFFLHNMIFNAGAFIAFLVAAHVIAKRNAVFTDNEALQMDFFVLAGAIINLIASYGREYYMRRVRGALPLLLWFARRPAKPSRYVWVCRNLC